MLCFVSSARAVMCALALVAVQAVPVAAQPAITAEMIVQALIPTAPVDANLTRGVKRTDPIPQQVALPTVSVPIEFEDDTHRLSISGMTTLRTVAEALRDPRLGAARYQIGGHAVLLNNPPAAQPLSARRAATVAEHLRAFYQITPDRLTPVGYGQTKLLDQINAGNPVNNRIEIINLTPLG